MKYQYRIIYSICFSLIAGMLVGYFLFNPVAGMTAFLIIFSIIQFSLSNYDNRIDTIVETTLYQDNSKKNRIRVKLANTGGKIIYLKSGGIITDDGIFIDFDEDPEDYDNDSDITLNPFGFPNIKIRPLYNPDNYYFPDSVNPGDAKSITIDNHVLLKLLFKNGYSEKAQISFKGIFFNSLGQEYSSKDSCSFEATKDFFNLS